MDDRAQRLERACEELAPQWSAERSARLYAATLQLRRRRDRRRTGVLAAASFVASAWLAAGLQGVWPADLMSALGMRSGGRDISAAHTLRFSDRSRAELLGGKSEIEAVEDGPERIVLKLIAGRAHFDVVPNRRRSFVVDASPYRVRVIGTVFDVDRSGDAVRVEVTRGHVRVDGPDGSFDLHAGDARRFERRPTDAAVSGSQVQRTAAPDVRAEVADPVAPLPEAPIEPTPETAPPTRRDMGPARTRTRAAADARGPSRVRHDADPGARTHAAESWRSLSRNGQYEAAFESLRHGAPVAEDPGALMDAADTARLSGHASSAVEYLKRVARDHGKSPVAPLAAFTLGRVYLEDLGQPDLAAEAFERSRELAPSGSLAQDALAREVEALSKAGNAHRAYLRAQEYLERYPGGRRVRAVRLYGGID